MDKDLILLYLNNTHKKLKDLINGSPIRNEILLYLEICIEVCNLLEKRFYKHVEEERDTFKQIQATVLNNDFYNAKELVEVKIKELEGFDKNIPTQNKYNKNNINKY